MARKLVSIKKMIPKYEEYNKSVQAAILDGFFRGDLSGSPKTIKYINSGQWNEAAEEYLSNREYRLSKERNSGVASRMEDNYRVFKSMVTHKKD